MYNVLYNYHFYMYNVLYNYHFIKSIANILFQLVTRPI
jgi:hypothetical protein